MLNSMREERIVREPGVYEFKLEMNADDYKRFYGPISADIAEDIVDQYLEYIGDDGEPRNFQIKENKANNLVEIRSTLFYIGNEAK